MRPFEGSRHHSGVCRILLDQQDFPRCAWRRSRTGAHDRSRRSGGDREQIRNGDVQRLRQIHDGPQRHVARTALDVRKVGAVYVGPPRQFLLRNPQIMPATADE